MVKINENFLNLEQNYLFSEIARRVSEFETKNTGKKIIKLGIGDVTQPLTENVIESLKCAVEDMSSQEGFKGYGPEQGYDFLKTAIRDYYKGKNVSLDLDEIFVSDGAKSDTGNITDLFDKDNTVLIPDPVYPVYVDTNMMNGRNIVYINATKENDFLPMPDNDKKVDLIYICSPNNPTGACYKREQLKVWVDYAIKNNAVILFDAAYESFITDKTLPTSIFEIEGAKKCAIEFCSLSKMAGFTGTRCGYTVISKELVQKSSSGEEVSLNRLWNRRQCTKFNGVSYIIQRGAASVFTENGLKNCEKTLNIYRENTKIIIKTMEKIGFNYFGGVNSPYIWFECPDNMDSWDFFDKILNEIAVVGTPGAGFGKNGKNYFRLTSFNNKENTTEAMKRFEELFG